MSGHCVCLGGRACLWGGWDGGPKLGGPWGEREIRGCGPAGGVRGQPGASRGQLESPRWEKAAGRKQGITGEELHRRLQVLPKVNPAAPTLPGRAVLRAAVAPGPGDWQLGGPHPLCSRRMSDSAPGSRWLGWKPCRPGRKPHRPGEGRALAPTPPSCASRPAASRP